jgi:hypothetical protein
MSGLTIINLFLLALFSVAAVLFYFINRKEEQLKA